VIGCILLSSTGCLRALHPVNPPAAEVCQAVKDLPRCCREHVHIFFLHGLDPLDYANLHGVREYFHSLGFVNTHYGQLYHGPTFTKEIRRIHAADPEARFVLMGFSAGANVARSMVHSLRDEDGIPIDLLVYMGGNTLENTPESRPEGVGKVVHILATGYIWKGTAIDDAENLKHADAWHFGSPTHAATLEVLTRELMVVAANVPYVERDYAAEQPDAPTPRAVVRHTVARLDEANFLKPAMQLRPVDEAVPEAVLTVSP
jgi:hypothetical protein